VAAARKVGLAASRDSYFIFQFVAPKMPGNSSIKSTNVFLTLLFVFYLQIFDERWQVKERKAKEMGEFPGIHIAPSGVYVLLTLKP